MKIAVLGSALAVAAAIWLAATRSTSTDATGDPPAFVEMLRRMDRIDARIDRLEASRGAELFAPLAHREPAPATGRARTGTAPTPAAGEPGSEPADDAERELGDLLARLVEVGQHSHEGRALWRELAERGLVDAALARFEQAAERRPGDADAQTELGDAIAQRSHLAKDAVEQIELARRADRAYDAALAVDPQHWRARFHKAVSYTFWPDFLGKAPAAIEHFETLVEQQELTAAEPGFEKTYLYLGNLYAQGGDHAKAVATWQAGLAIFPGDAALLAALGK